MTQVLRIRNELAFNLPSLDSIMRRALASDPLIVNVNEAMDEVRSRLGDERFALFVAQEDGAWTGVLLAGHGRSAFSRGCVVLHVHNEGTRQSLDAMLEALVEYARDGGYDRIIGMDMNAKPRGFKRLFGRFSKRSRLTGEIHVFEVGDEQ